MEAKEPVGAAEERPRPLLMVDIDGVISLFGGPALAGTRGDRPSIAGSFHSIDGMLHFLSADAAAHLLALSGLYDLVWASGWEERANEHLPHLLGMPPGLPFLRFSRDVGGQSAPKAHWKLDEIDAYAGGRPLAWIDDALTPACHEWAQARGTPTLLVETEPDVGLTALQADELKRWAEELQERTAPDSTRS
jgi:HAD domain in Swiss Army Knife RNA repair proteins